MLGRGTLAYLRAAGFLMALAGVLAAQGTAPAEETADAAMSSPTVADEWDLEQDFLKIEQQWQTLLALVDDAGLFNLQSDEVSAWSVGMQIGHVELTLNLVADEMEKMLADPALGVGEKYGEFAEGIFSSGIIPRGVGKAPETIIVQGEPDAKQIRAKLIEARERWAGLHKRDDAIAASKATYAHFALGAFTPSQWTRFMAIHTAHHLKIVRDILAATTGAGLPE